MDREKVKYIISYFSRFLTDKERKAIVHYSTSYKLDYSQNPESLVSLKEEIKKQGRISGDPVVLKLLEDGFENLSGK